MTDRLHCPIFHATDGRCCPDTDPDCMLTPLPTIGQLQADFFRLMLAALAGTALLGLLMLAALHADRVFARQDLQQQELRGTLAIRQGVRHD